VRRDYNSWVASETLEDYALRFTPRSPFASGANGAWPTPRLARPFLVLEALGATLLMQYGFINAFWAILATGADHLPAGLPISVYAAATGWTWTC
jgi:hypothetical protein